jgi:4-aminobutyrate aminotransferase/(S)-3-amino-2-methylpropionate transaminase
MELVTGEGGFIVAPRRYVQGLRRLCDEHGIVLILDEIQTGFGRTGRLFAAEHYGVEADLVTLAKSLAGGLPLSAVVGRADLLDGVPVGGLGGTFGGNPVSCAAALATLDVFEEEQLVAHAETLGRQLMQRLQKWFLRFPRIGNVRGLGPMCALEFVTDRGTREPDKEYLASLSKRCCARGVLLISSGTHGNVLRFLFPLVITAEQLDEGLAVIEEELENG